MGTTFNPAARNAMLQQYAKILKAMDPTLAAALDPILAQTAAPVTAQAAPNAATPAAGNAATGQYAGKTNFTDDEEKQIIDVISKEAGIDPKKGGNTKDWGEYARKNPDKVQVFDKNGNPIQLKDGESIQNKTVIINSPSLGPVKIDVGGDGELNGRDDKILSVGGAVAGNNIGNGLNQLNGNLAGVVGNAATPLANNAAATQTAKVTCPKCNGAGCDQCKGTGFIEKPVTQQAKAAPVGAFGAAPTAAGLQTAQAPMFDPNTIRNLMAALLAFGV